MMANGQIKGRAVRHLGLRTVGLAKPVGKPIEFSSLADCNREGKNVLNLLTIEALVRSLSLEKD
jgi:hypothetical protein